jgi:hypothetical protein
VDQRADVLILELAARNAEMADTGSLLQSILPRLEEPYCQSRVIEVSRRGRGHSKSVSAVTLLP